MARKKFSCSTEGCDGYQFAMSPICTRCFVAQPVKDRIPPVPATADLSTFPDMPLDVVKLHRSDMHREVTPEEGWYALQLWMKSWHTVPAASLANDDRSLALDAGLGRDVRTWKRVRDGAIRGFVECSDGRLYHLVLADKACNAWDVKKGRVRGANLTNTKARNGQDVDKQGNARRSAPRSIYKERDGERALSDTLSESGSQTHQDDTSAADLQHSRRTSAADVCGANADETGPTNGQAIENGSNGSRSAPRPPDAQASATEQNRTELRLQQSSSSSTARTTPLSDPAKRAALAVELGQELVRACGYDQGQVLEFGKVHSWLNSEITGDEIRACIPIVAGRIQGLKDKPRALLPYVDPIMRAEIAAMRNGAGSQPHGQAAAHQPSSGPAYRNRYRCFRQNPMSWLAKWGDPIEDTPAHIRSEVDAEFGGPPAGAA